MRNRILCNDIKRAFDNIFPRIVLFILGRKILHFRYITEMEEKEKRSSGEDENVDSSQNIHPHQDTINYKGSIIFRPRPSSLNKHCLSTPVCPK